jgi:hypothetical protein
MSFYITSDQRDGSPKKVFGPYDGHPNDDPVRMDTLARPIYEEHGGVIEFHTEDIRCDFCSDAEVKWSYPANDFIELSSMWGSAGDWAACDACHDLIEAGNQRGLSERSVERYFIHHSIIPDTKQTRALMLREITMLHQAFFHARSGGATAETKENPQDGKRDA